MSDPRNSEPASAEKARSFLQAGDWQACEEQLTRVLAQHPTHAPALHVRGALRQQQGRTAEALAFYTQSYEVDHNPDALLSRAALLLHQGQTAESRADLERLLKIAQSASQREQAQELLARLGRKPRGPLLVSSYRKLALITLLFALVTLPLLRNLAPAVPQPEPLRKQLARSSPHRLSIFFSVPGEVRTQGPDGVIVSKKVYGGPRGGGSGAQLESFGQVLARRGDDPSRLNSLGAPQHEGTSPPQLWFPAEGLRVDLTPDGKLDTFYLFEPEA